eukprot:NODE_16_length_49026_cov_1.035992.p27 type:complete len:112 gc:universal NODE_16_length_49026_cov_1.035992:1037-702(-)
MVVACAYVYSESITIINQILNLFKKHYKREIPCFITDRDAAYIHSLNHVYPQVPKLWCIWHIKSVNAMRLNEISLDDRKYIKSELSKVSSDYYYPVLNVNVECNGVYDKFD